MTFKKYFILPFLVIALFTTTYPQKSEAQIPVTDVLNIAQNILVRIIKEDQLVEQVQTLIEVQKQLDLLIGLHEEWRQLARNLEALAGIDASDILKILTANGLAEPITQDYEVPLVTSEQIWGDDVPQARVIHEKNLEFVHSNIVKINKLHTSVVDRTAKLKTLGGSFSDLETPKQMLAKINAVIVEMNLLEQDRAILEALEIQVFMGEEALNLEEAGRTAREILNPSDVGR